jgi:hypothetical protein
LVEGVDDELDLRRALHQRPDKDPNLLRETAASKGDHSVDGADRLDRFQQAKVSDIRFTVAVAIMLSARVIDNRCGQRAGERVDEPLHWRNPNL